METQFTAFPGSHNALVTRVQKTHRINVLVYGMIILPAVFKLVGVLQ